MKFTDEIIQAYPYPLAIAAKRFNDATEHVERFMNLANLIEVTIKFLATIALVEYLRDEQVDEPLQRHLHKLSRPSLGHWNELLRASVNYYRGKSDYPFTVAELRDVYKEKVDAKTAEGQSVIDGFHFIAEYLQDTAKTRMRNVSLQNFLDLMVTYRNHTWGHGIVRLDVDTCADHTEILQPALQAVLARLAFLTNYPLYYLHEVKVLKGEYVHTAYRYMGASSHKDDLNLASYHRERRLYLCSLEAQPLLSLHPLFVIRRRHFYVLQFNDRNEEITYIDCATGDEYEPESLQSYQITRLAHDQHNKLGNLELPVPPEDVPELLPIPQPTLADLLAQLDDEARQALSIGLGEALRIGQFWLGVEFLLMGLSKQPQSVMAELLAMCQIPAGDLRGTLRGLVPIREKAWRKQRQVEALGEQAWPALVEIEPLTLLEQIAGGNTPAAAVTPRLVAVLRAAAVMAGQEKISPTHLLAATLKQPVSPAVNLLLALVAQAGQNPRALLAWVQGHLDGWPPGEDVAKPAAEIVRPTGKPTPPRPPAATGDVLAQIGRDLTALARQGKLRPAIGQGAHQAMVQMSHILQQTQANNPILLGDPGVGKTAIAEGLAWRIALGEQHGQPVAPQLAGWRIVEVSAATLLAGTRHRGELEEKLQQLLDEVRQAGRQTIVFIDEIHTLLGGRAEGGLGSIAEALKPALARGEFPCIGATTVAEYQRHIETDPALARRFTPVWLEEPTADETIAIATEVVAKHLGPAHNVIYPEAAIQEAVLLASRYLHDEFLPGKAIKLLDQAGPRVLMGASLRGQPLGQAEQRGFGIVSVETIRQIVAERTGIPLAHMEQDEAQRLRQLETVLRQQVLGQDEALVQVARVIRRARAGLAHPDKPLGVFLFAGPTGVGKTELALALAEFLFAEKDALLRLDMSEFMEKHTVSRLTGSPPGYVGYAEEGQLTGHLRRRPYSVVLLDEMEKAHPEVQNLFLQLFDAGRLTDARGRRADGRNALFIMTTNLGAKEAMGLTQHRQSYREKLQAAIEDHFTPEFLGRIDRIVYFESLTEEALLAVFDKLLAQTVSRFAAMAIEIQVAPELKQAICQQYTDVRRGARDLQRAIDDEIVAPLSDLKLDGQLQAGKAYLLRPDGIEEVTPTSLPKATAAVIPRMGQRAAAAEAPPEPVVDLGLDPEERRRRALVQPQLATLQVQLADLGITLTLTEDAWEWLCSPYMAPDEVKKDVQAAFQLFVAERILKQVAEGRFTRGAQVEAYRNLQFELDFRQLERGEE